VVSVSLMAAPLTGEPILRLPIILGAIPALGTRPRCVTRIDRHQRNTSQLCFVRETVAKMRERPIGQSTALLTANRYSVTNAVEILNRNAHAECLCLINKPPTYIMVYPTLKPPLFAGQSFKPTFSGLGSATLKRLACFGVSLAMPFNVGPGESLARRIGGYLDYPEVNTKECLSRLNGRFGHVGSAIQKKHTISVDKIGLSFEMVKLAGEVFAKNVRHDNAASHRQQTYSVDALKAERSLVVGHGPMISEDRAPCLVAGEALDSLSNGADSGLTGHAKTVPQLPVASFVDGRLRKDASIKTNASGKRRGPIERLHVIQQRIGLFGIGQQFHLHDKFHGGIVGQHLSVDNRKIGAVASSAA
jgi:hypothetical protein